MGTRHEIRIKVLESLYQIDFCPTEKEDIIKRNLLDLPINDREFYLTLVAGIVDKTSIIDQKIADNLKSTWHIERIALLDKCILRLAVYEILYMDKIPSAVSINEAIKLAKIYSKEDSRKFINGVLGKIILGN